MNITDEEFSHLNGYIYLDHAGATLYSQSQLRSSTEELAASAFANPHSRGGCLSEQTDLKVKQAREQILHFLGASSLTHSVVFTSGTTGSLRLVSELFPWDKCASRFYYHAQSHTSVLGIREVVKDHECVSKPFSSAELATGLSSEETNPKAMDLVVFPAECNFSGEKLDLAVISSLKKKHPTSLVLLDAAKYVATSPLDLSTCDADFVALSFYKMFGYPTGIGALILKRNVARFLRKGYYGGGTVSAVSSQTRFHCLRAGFHSAARRGEGGCVSKDIEKVQLAPSAAELSAVLEDGTIPFTSIVCLKHGFKALENVGGMKAVQKHTFTLAQRFYEKASRMRYPRGSPVFEFYGCSKAMSMQNHGSIVAFNLLRERQDRSGERYVGYAEVNEVASLNNIQLRVGCFCNPGACARYLGIDDDRLKSNLSAGHVCWDDTDLLDGHPTGCIRVSFGYMSKESDSQALLDLIRSHFVLTVSNVRTPTAVDATNGESSGSETVCSVSSAASASPALHRVESIALYPVKSCRPLSVASWYLDSGGLEFDRRWAIVDQNGEVLNQKLCPELCLIQPDLDLERKQLVLRWAGPLHPAPPFVRVPLVHAQTAVERFRLTTRNGAKEYTGRRVSCPTVSLWISQVLGRKCCQLVTARDMPSASDPKGSRFVNQGDMLVVTHASVDAVVKDMKRYQDDNPQKQISIPTREEFEASLRPNIVLSSSCVQPYQEDLWKSLRSSGSQGESVELDVTSKCTRCRMININQNDGSSKNGPLLTLAKSRREKSRILFGSYATLHNRERRVKIEVGMTFRPVSFPDLKIV